MLLDAPMLSMLKTSLNALDGLAGLDTIDGLDVPCSLNALDGLKTLETLGILETLFDAKTYLIRSTFSMLKM
jgi:hypothetical protein